VPLKRGSVGQSAHRLFDGKVLYDTFILSYMSTSKLDTSGIFQPLTFHPNQTRLTLPADSVCIRKNGIEFRSERSIPVWTEMTVDLFTGDHPKKLHCIGVVVACTGNRHTGYVVSMVLMNLSKASQERLDLLAFSQLA
jgi:hypothetical protein